MSPLSRAEYWFKLRQSNLQILELLKIFFWKNKANVATVKKDEKIVIIGTGIASLSLVNQLRNFNFSKVQLISRDENFGGACVNYGCMPSEYAFETSHLIQAEKYRSLNELIGDLRVAAKGKFLELNYPIILNEVNGIENKKVKLSNGDTIPFDRLVIATGAEYPKPSRIPLNTKKLIKFNELWSLIPPKHIVIYAKDNVSAISLGESLRLYGFSVTVLLSGMNPFVDFPSYKYYFRTTEKNGLKILPQIRLIRVDDDGISYELGSEIVTIFYDYFLIASRPVPNIPLIDSKEVNVIDIDFNCGTLSWRPDIFFAGDCSGFFTATEAELQGKLIAEFLITGKPVDLSKMLEVPIILNGIYPLAMIGDPWVFKEKTCNWVEVDFRSIGWTRLSGQDGKVWYLFNRVDKKFEAIHICHPQAKELIGVAISFCNKPLNELYWVYSIPHPSVGEIFKVLLDKELEKLASN